MTSKLTTDPQKWPEMTQIPKIGPLISRKLMTAQQKNLTPLIFSPENLSKIAYKPLIFTLICPIIPLGHQ